MYVRLHHGVYISCVFVGVERLSFTHAWRVGRLLCGRVVCCLRAFCFSIASQNIYNLGYNLGYDLVIYNLGYNLGYLGSYEISP